MNYFSSPSEIATASASFPQFVVLIDLDLQVFQFFKPHDWNDGWGTTANTTVERFLKLAGLFPARRGVLLYQGRVPFSFDTSGVPADPATRELFNIDASRDLITRCRSTVVLTESRAIYIGFLNKE